MNKILLLANDSTFVYNLRLEILEALRKEAWKVVIACEIKEHLEELKALGYKIIPVSVDRRGKNFIKDLSLLRHYKRIIKNEKPDVVLTNNIKPNVYGGIACSNKRIPYIVNVCGLGTPLEGTGLMRIIVVSLYKRGVKKANCVFFQNIESEEFFKKRGMVLRHCHLLPGSGVNTSRFPVLDYPHGDTVDFLFISRIMKKKGIEQYLEAAEIICKKYPQVVFHVIGRCDDKKYLKKIKILHNKGVIRYHGQQNSILPFQKISSCTVHPTYYPEGMSNVLLESASCARPIITTDRSGCREIIDDGVNGFICRQKDTADLVTKIEKFLGLSWEQKREMGLAGRRKIEKEFDRKIVVNAYLDEIKRVKLNESYAELKEDRS